MSKHEEAWKEYGCTLMSDGWTDARQRHLINFLANSPAGTYFIASVDASSEAANANMLADLLEKQINKIGKENVVQIVTDNAANYRAAGRKLMERIPHLFWTPCAAHYLDLLLEDIGKIKEFNACITNAKKVSRFIYKHGRLHNLMRETIGGDLVRPGITRFATSFLTLASMHRHRNGLWTMFVSDEWHQSKFSVTQEGQQAENIVLSIQFWRTVENCLRASQPLLIALRIADGDETPAAPEITAAMDKAKATIKESLKEKPKLCAEVISLFEKRWEQQMEQTLYGAALFLNPGKFFALRDKDRRQATRLRSMFNDVKWKMISNEQEQILISKQADDYERTEGCFSKRGAIRDRNNKNPRMAYELQSLAKRIVSLCCSASGCERNWSEFAAVHTKKRNRLEHQRLNKLVYVSYNRKMENRFASIREAGSKGKKSSPLVLEEFLWENDWVEESEEDDIWPAVDEALDATQSLRGRNLPRAAAAGTAAPGTSTQPLMSYARTRKRSRIAADDHQEDEGDQEDVLPAARPSQTATENEEEESESVEPGAARDGFEVDEDLL